MLYEQALFERTKLESKIKKLQSQIADLPSGTLSCVNNNGYQKWFVRDNHKLTYLPKRERKLAEALAAKRYLSLQLQNALQEMHAIDSYLTLHNQPAHLAEQDFLTSPLYKDLLAHSFLPHSQELCNWQNAPYEKNTKYPDGLTVQAVSGIFVRSKSEALILLYLQKNNIPFRYEAALHLGDVVLYPDFTIRHPKTGKLFYWEHFGLADDPFYIKTISSKLHLYLSHGILPDHQLITTYETKNQPLTATMIEHILDKHFLSAAPII